MSYFGIAEHSLLAWTAGHGWLHDRTIEAQIDMRGRVAAFRYISSHAHRMFSSRDLIFEVV